uniref:Crustacean hyperglycemic hormones 5 n=1 Tax=Penaeus japonicus TaxID=27405 RepID=CHH5_PENJP|nr:RecName: Full=Crustacean hyperglycemic hormones 5; AltName: Full=Pej-SGP-V; Contains: RecName: Full=CHH precursor-related peptide 5; Short=CPRP 5; Contains: RecName: Full=Crustacean hyperglycemic hormone 5; Short=CHH 5; Flags: Precursor [Penaeus japonicus]BAA22561.1 Pej-SGP-V [Penaeus japonicus]
MKPGNTSFNMVSFRMVWTAMMATLLVAGASSAGTRSSEDLSAPEDRSLSKRLVFDPSCAGVYDRVLLGKLNRLCDDCYNVFREPNVATECRSNCFYNLAFVQCLEYLMPPSLHEEYQANVQMVGK